MHAHPHSPDSDPELKEALQKLRSAGLRISGARRALIDVLRNEELPIKIEDIHQRLQPGSCDLATIYRSLSAFEDIGLVRRCFLFDGTSLFEINTSQRAHHHHIICKRCDRIDRFEICGAKGLEPVVRQRGYSDVFHLMEFFGVCEDCRGDGTTESKPTS